MGYRPEEEYFSTSFRGFLEWISPRQGSTTRNYPVSFVEEGNVRATSLEDAKTWFRRLVDETVGDKVEEWQIEDNLAVFATVRYDNSEIKYARIHVIVAEEDLTTLYIEDESDCWYFRLEYDTSCLGQMYAEALPHIHTQIDGPPRFPHYPEDGNLILDFFDFIYRNFLYNKWYSWARYASQHSGTTRISIQDLNALENAFAASQYQLLTNNFQTQLVQLKRACKGVKDRTFSARIDVQNAILLSY